MVSHAWDLSRLGSQGWTVVRLSELGRMCQPVSPPEGPGVSLLLCMSPQSPDRVRPSYTESKPSASTGWWSLGAGRALKSALGSMSPGGGLPPPASFLRVAPPTDDSALSRASAGVGICPGLKVKGEEVKRHKTLGICSGTFHSHLQHRNGTFMNVLVAPVTRAGHEEILPPCGHFP